MAIPPIDTSTAARERRHRPWIGVLLGLSAVALFAVMIAPASIRGVFESRRGSDAGWAKVGGSMLAGRSSSQEPAVNDDPSSTEPSVWDDLPPGTAPPADAQVFVIDEDASAVGDRITYDQAIAFEDVPLALLPEQQPRPRALVVSGDFLDRVRPPSEGPLGLDGNHHYYALLAALWTGHELLILDSNTRDLAEAMDLVDVAPPFDPHRRPLPTAKVGAGQLLAGEIVQFLPGTLEGWQTRSVGAPVGFGVQEVPGLGVGPSDRPAYGALNASLWNGLSQ